jgi:hypothetical protein
LVDCIAVTSAALNRLGCSGPAHARRLAVEQAALAVQAQLLLVVDEPAYLLAELAARRVHHGSLHLTFRTAPTAYRNSMKAAASFT